MIFNMRNGSKYDGDVIVYISVTLKWLKWQDLNRWDMTFYKYTKWYHFIILKLLTYMFLKISFPYTMTMFMKQVMVTNVVEIIVEKKKSMGCSTWLMAANTMEMLSFMDRGQWKWLKWKTILCEICFDCETYKHSKTIQPISNYLHCSCCYRCQRLCIRRG